MGDSEDLEMSRVVVKEKVANPSPLANVEDLPKVWGNWREGGVAIRNEGG